MQHNMRFWILLSGATIGAGWLCSAIGMPAAWFLGPMAAAGVLAGLRRTKACLPVRLSIVSQAIIGGAVSTALTPDALGIFLHYWFAILSILVVVLVFSVVSALLLARIVQLDIATALLGMMPGGAPGMVALSEALDADTRLVAVMQTVRLIIVLGLLAVVTTVALPAGGAVSHQQAVLPDLAASGHLWQAYLLTLLITVLGAWLGIALRLPAGALVGPALIGVLPGLLGIQHAEWPSLLLNSSYACIGVSVGLEFNLQALHTARRLLPAFLLSTLAMVISMVVMGLLLSLFTGVDLFSAYLATTPGGLNMVTIIALESGSNVTLVLTINLLRFLVIVLAGPVLVRWCIAHAPPGPPAPQQERQPESSQPDTAIAWDMDEAAC